MKWILFTLAVLPVLVGLCTLGTPLSASAALIVNGSFETGTFTGSSSGYESLGNTVGTGSTAITGWTVTAGNIDWIKTYWQAADGHMSLDMDGTNPGTIQQTGIVTVIGQQYQVTFSLSGNPDGPPLTKALHVDASVGAVSQVFNYTIGTNTEGNMQWQTETLLFTANQTSTTLTFTSGDNGSPYGPALDNVSITTAGGVVSVVPEPSMFVIWSLIGVVVGTASIWRRKWLA